MHIHIDILKEYLNKLSANLIDKAEILRVIENTRRECVLLLLELENIHDCIKPYI